MLRRLALCAIAVLLPLGVAAAIPSGVNLHNGYIVVYNNVRSSEPVEYDIQISHEHRGWFDRQQGTGNHPVIFNRCCIAAGSIYEVLVTMKVNGELGVAKAATNARLCNIRGIPFGYSAFVVTGQLSRRDTGAAIGRALTIHVVSQDCPRE